MGNRARNKEITNVRNIEEEHEGSKFQNIIIRNEKNIFLFFLKTKWETNLIGIKLKILM